MRVVTLRLSSTPLPSPCECCCSCSHAVFLSDCRLCGELVCRSCSSKLHLPHKFEKKGKDLSRVCHGCLFLVLAKRVVGGETHPAVRFRVTQYVWGNVEPASMAEKIKLVPRVFFMPEWRSVHESSSCFKCAALTEKRHRQRRTEEGHERGGDQGG